MKPAVCTCCLTAYFVVSVSAEHARGQEAVANSPLAVRQQHVERLVQELERKYVSLKLTIAQSDPARAQRLQEALNRTKEMLLQKRTAEVTELLQQAQLDLAGQNQQALLSDIRSLLALLMDQTADQRTLEEEVAQLSQQIETIKRLVDDERNLQNRVVRIPPNADPSELESLVQVQANLAEQTNALAQHTPGQLPPPGQQPLAAAHQAMGQAMGELSRQKPAEAAQQQGRAVQELLAALREVEQRSKDLAQQQASESLGKLAAHFRDMLEQQKALTARTRAIENKRQSAGGALVRSDRLAVRAIGEAERSTETVLQGDNSMAGLAGKAEEALKMLPRELDGVLPSLIGQLREDFISVGARLANDLETGERTATLQADIEATLEQLAQALHEARQSQLSGDSSDPSGNASGKKNQPSKLPASAELKLLRAGQLRINRRTAALDQVRRSSAEADPSLEHEISQLAERQTALAAFAKEILNRQSN